jgi:hypothetical protein
MIGSVLLSACLLSLSAQSGPEAPCFDAAGVGRVLREQLMPRWFDVTPREVRQAFPAPLELVADGSGSLWRQQHGKCELLFGFRELSGGSERLQTVTVIVRGTRQVVLDAGATLAQAVGFRLSFEQSMNLKNGETVTLSTRDPEDPRLPGTLTILTISVRSENGWILDFHFDRTRDL